MRWKRYYVCSYHYRSTHFPGPNDPCPVCGKNISQEGIVQRWVSTAIWWNPLTWETGRWETKR